MTRLLVLVEGQSEEVFVKRTLTPHLQNYGVYVQSPKILWTKRLASGGGYRGGASSWHQVRRDLSALSTDANAWITTILDFYGLPDNTPGMMDQMQESNAQNRVLAVQMQLGASINHQRFIPFLALHEFEAWIFSDPQVVENHFTRPQLADQMRDVVQKTGGPEMINHGASTHPKARLRHLIGSYKETADGPTLIEKIGLKTIRGACPHFDRWLSQLEGLGSSTD